MIFKLKKAAMFGLDARIALAIFGALSVISGAALYSAIEQAQVTKVVTTFNEFEKAVTAYLLDIQRDFPQHDISLYEYVTLELIESTNSKWKGPYLSAEALSGEDHYILEPATGLILFLSRYRNDTWGDGILSGGNSCIADEPCFYYIKTHLNRFKTDPNSVAEALDEKFDGGDGYNAGRFRANFYNGVSTDVIGFLQLMPILNQP